MIDFIVKRGEPFTDKFDFKDSAGKPINAPSGDYRLVVEHGDYAKVFSIGRGLKKQRNGVVWSMSESETLDLQYSVMYYVLYFNDNELARGVLRMQ